MQPPRARMHLLLQHGDISREVRRPPPPASPRRRRYEAVREVRRLSVCGKSSVIKQTLEMQSEYTSATKRSPKRGVLSQGCLDELMIKGPARLTALSKPCSLLGRDSDFIGSRVEETEARINRKYQNSLRSL